MTLPQARRLLHGCMRVVPGQVHGRGYAWYRDRLLPAHRLLLASPDPDDTWLAAETWLLRGDLCYLNGAFNQALRAYRQAVRLEPDDPVSWAELAQLNADSGRHRQAQWAYQQVSRLDPEAVQPTQDCQLHDLESTVVRAADRLALIHPGQALEVLKHEASSEARLMRTCAFGALGWTRRCLQEWTALSHAEELDLTFACWFYLPPALFDDQAFWTVLLALIPRLSGGASPSHVTQPLIGLEVGRRRSGVPVMELMFRFQLARTSANLPEMQRLAHDWPEWREPAEWTYLLRRRSANRPTAASPIVEPAL